MFYLANWWLHMYFLHAILDIKQYPQTQYIFLMKSFTGNYSRSNVIKKYRRDKVISRGQDNYETKRLNKYKTDNQNRRFGSKCP